MKPILVIYGTTEGHTRKIAEFIAARLRSLGREVHLVDSASPAAGQLAPVYAGAILGGSLHEHKHQSALAHFIKANIGWLNAIPTAFFSVSLAMASRDAQERAEAKKLAEEFLEQTGLNAGFVRLVAGALKYTEYNYFKRALMRMIAQREGGDTDTSRDHEYTDWDDVAQFVDEYAAATRTEVVDAT
jgi:menaquinone-dependent protoporphyrinogen oxidase